jgi:hypothetical protein
LWHCRNAESGNVLTDEPPYDGADEFAKSLLVADDAVRRCIAAGGRPWVPGAPLQGRVNVEEAERKAGPLPHREER